MLLLAAAMLLSGPVMGLDHVPVAVRDLEAAGATYRRLGFVLKPGRPHANGIRNLHAKFPDGTEIELITAPAATDSLTSTYRRHLEAGDGPAFLALYAPSARPEIDTPPYVFFGPRNASPTDRPEHFAHPNTARALAAVWLAGDLAAERRMLSALAAPLTDHDVLVPDRIRAAVARLPEGDVVLLPPSRQIVTGRPIVGVTLAVSSRDAARAVLARERVAIREAGESLFVPPSAAHGLWIEMREQSEKR
jgi:catechol 2,3-dioxygenase-like lactoylglutathione lyase family enzyme